MIIRDVDIACMNRRFEPTIRDFPAYSLPGSSRGFASLNRDIFNPGWNRLRRIEHSDVRPAVDGKKACATDVTPGSLGIHKRPARALFLDAPFKKD